MGHVSLLLPGSNDADLLAKLLFEFNGHITDPNIDPAGLNGDRVIQLASLSGDKIVGDSIGTDQLVNGSITADELAETVDPTTPVVSSLPGSPVNSQIVYYQSSGMATDGIVWLFKYRPGSGSTHKWEFAGGPPWVKEVDTAETLNSTTYTDLATAGPSVTLPLAGDYLFHYGMGNDSDTGVAYRWLMSPNLNGTTPTDTDAVGMTDGDAGAVSQGNSVARIRRFNGRAAADLIKMQYRRDGGDGQPRRRFLAVTPVRVS